MKANAIHQPARIRVAWLLGMFVASVSYQSVQACSCLPPPPPKEALAQAVAVFSGKVEKVELVTLTPGNGDQKFKREMRKVTVRVAESWKGTNAPTLVVWTEQDSGLCGYDFTQGDTYLIYAQERQEGGAKEKMLHTHLCTRTRPLTRAQEDLRDLGTGQKPPAATK